MNAKRKFNVKFIEQRQEPCGCCYNWHEVYDGDFTIREAVEWAKIKSDASPYPAYIYKKKVLIGEYEDGKRQK
jgi:hypothetical protein